MEGTIDCGVHELSRTICVFVCRHGQGNAGRGRRSLFQLADTFLENGKKFVEGPLAGNLHQYQIGFTPVDVTIWIALFGVFLIGLGKALHGNLIPVKDPTLPASLAFENY